MNDQNHLSSINKASGSTWRSLFRDLGDGPKPTTEVNRRSLNTIAPSATPMTTKPRPSSCVCTLNCQSIINKASLSITSAEQRQRRMAKNVWETKIHSFKSERKTFICIEAKKKKLQRNENERNKFFDKKCQSVKIEIKLETNAFEKAMSL